MYHFALSRIEIHKLEICWFLFARIIDSTRIPPHEIFEAIICQSKKERPEL